MANTENINVVMNEEVIDTAVQAAEAIPVKADNKFGVIGTVVVVGGAIITGVALGIRYFKNKKKQKEMEVDFTVVDNGNAQNDDFEEADSEE